MGSLPWEPGLTLLSWDHTRGNLPYLRGNLLLRYYGRRAEIWPFLYY